jgi:hypothetical protein
LIPSRPSSDVTIALVKSFKLAWQCGSAAWTSKPQGTLE